MARTEVRGGQILDASVSLTADVTGTLGVPNGGTGAVTLTGLVVGNGTSAMTTVTAPSGTVVGTSDTQTLTNKRLSQRVVSVSSSATPAINTDNGDLFNLLSLATNVTSFTTSLTGTPTDGQDFVLRIKSASAQTLAWGTSFQSSGVATLPTTSVAGKTITLGFMYDGAAGKWTLMAVDATGY